MNRSRATAIATTGVIMMMIRTDIAHHCGPRVAFWAATWSGIVWALALVRTSAMRNSFQAKMRTMQERRDEARDRDRQHDRADDPVDGRAVHRGGLLELAGQRREVVAHQPDDDRQVRGHVGGDEGDDVVEQVDLLEQDVQRHRDRDRRQDPLGDQPERDVAVAEARTEPPADRLGAGCRKMTSADATAIARERAPRWPRSIDSAIDADEQADDRRPAGR